jgi:hypothetical protein
MMLAWKREQSNCTMFDHRYPLIASAPPHSVLCSAAEGMLKATQDLWVVLPVH